MNILVTGATGFIASQIVTDLLTAGHNVTCCARNTKYAATLFPDCKVVACNFYKDTYVDAWIPRLDNIDVVVNCVGILYHPRKIMIWKAHYETPKALFDASVKSGVKQIIQISALGVEKSSVDYSTSKKAAEDYVFSLPIKTVVLRPSLVYAKGSYGGTSLFRGMVSLPFVLPLPGKGEQRFQPIHLTDLSKAIVKFVDSQADHKTALTAVGPKSFSLIEVFTKLRAWLGFPKAFVIKTPLWIIKLRARLGDPIPYSAINSSSIKMLLQNNVATEEQTNKFFDAVGFVPKDYNEGLWMTPSTVQDHWHARLYFLRPLLKFSIAIVWIFSGISSAFLYPKIASFALLGSIGVSGVWQPILLYGASALDLLLGFAMVFNYKLRKVCTLQLLVIIIYSVIVTWKLPYLWLEPFAPILKNIPLIAATLVFMAIESER